ncbi:unnamed protein product [Caenorhabditis sp. 36 PRJEB53466]|nr:unnamed protein product [Caenorhabditis sp. 36 PRJEB53466]
MVTVIPRIITTPYPRTRLPLYLYTFSIGIACSLLYWNLLYCKNYNCASDKEKELKLGATKHLLQYFPVVAAPIIMFVSFSWLIVAIHYASSSCILNFNFMEMPSAVFCSLLGGISSVIEIHFSIDVAHVQWTDQWLLSAASSILLCLLHASIAFTLQ